MKKGGGSQKGSSFERDIAKKLSQWWTQDLESERDDIFWRTSGSGARATSRTKAHKKTAYEYGDLTFTDPIGKPFIDCFLIECKCGYTDEIDVLDFFHREDTSILFQWWDKAVKEAEEAGRKHVLLIVKRNRKPEVCFIDRDFGFNIQMLNGRYNKAIRLISLDKRIDVILLEEFLKINPKLIELVDKK